MIYKMACIKNVQFVSDAISILIDCFITNSTDAEFLSYAYGIVSDYITLELCEKLSEHLGLEKLKPANANKRKSLIELENNTLKRMKTEDNFTSANSLETVSPPSMKEKKVSTKEKKMAKAASGTKSISSFFVKK